MFALIASPRADVDERDLTAMSAALRSSARPVTTFRDAGGRAGAAAGVLGALPEDAFDRQPLAADDLVFVAQARLDNRSELLERLGAPRERWNMLADSDVLHLAYRRWAADCVQHLTGDYAFAAWHRGSGKVVAAVDHLATARLYYAQFGGRVALSTQLGALLACPDVPKDLNFDALGLLVAPRIELGNTPYTHIRELTGGHLLVFESGTLTCRRWWQPDTTIRSRYRDARDYAAQARELFDAAVSSCLRSTGGIAATLSGGLDSSLVAATAAAQLRVRGGMLATFTSVPEPGLPCATRPGWEIDDTPYVRAIAAQHDNMQTHFVTPGGLCTLDVLPAIHARSRTPVRNGANQIWLSRICEAAAQGGTRVVLNGFKGNATLSQAGQGGITQLLRTLHWRAALQVAQADAGASGTSTLRALARHVVGRPAADLFRRKAAQERFAAQLGVQLLAPAFRARHAQALSTPAQPLTSRAARIAFAIKPTHGWGADYIAQWGVEMRDPTADRRLMECLLTFPPDAFLAGGRGRGLARSIGEGRVPDAVRLRATAGEQMPELAAIVAAHGADYRSAFERAAATAAFRGIVDIDRLRRAVDILAAGQGTRPDAQAVDRALDVALFMSEAATPQ